MIAGSFATSALADGHLELTCRGEGWDLDISGGFARLAFPQPTEMELVLDTPAEGKEWPRALTLLGDRDTAVLIVDRRMCETSEYSAELLTQRGQTPIFITGCCESTK